jgi:tRNA-specific 2-thiouridylase
VTNKNITQNKRVAVGLSGGVDSSVAAYLLKKQGYDVVGVFIQCWDEKADGCSADEDRSYAVQAAMKMDIHFVHLDYKKEYKDKVISYFYEEYKAGRTPNPDVMCNKEIKFGMFFDWAMRNDFDYVATGHYAGIEEDGGVYKLLKGKDITKDQSYFLYLLGQEQLSKTLFPLGDLKKSDVRKIAKENMLPTANRADSTGICFIGEVDIKEFLSKQIKPENGPVVNTRGDVIGEHQGVWFYTIGQRHGFDVNKYQGVPVYVIDKDPKKNTLIVGTYDEAKSDNFVTEAPYWIGKDPLDGKDKLVCEVRIRHLGEMYGCTLSSADGEGLQVDLNEKVFGLAPGQSAVFYDGEVVLGGAVIN